MTSISSLEPQARGLILAKTTFGDLEIELFTQQCPKATRNFVQLCLDNYYNGTIINRVEKDFIAIGGVVLECNGGTVEEEERLSDEKFKDEFHPRLKFSRRGLIATANTEKDANGPQFFFTLGPAPELQNKHTIFGRLKGDSIYHLVELNECQVDDDLLPLSEKKIIDTIVIENPFPELVARQKSIRVDDKDTITQQDTYDPLNKPKPDPSKSKKLSFYQESDDDDDEEDDSDRNHVTQSLQQPQNVATKLTIQPNDLIQTSDNVKSDPTDTEQLTSSEGRTTELEPVDEDARERRLREIRAQIQTLKQQIEDNSDSGRPKLSERRTRIAEANKDEFAKSQHQSMDSSNGSELHEVEPRLAPKKGRSRERDTLESVQSFKKKLKKQSESRDDKLRELTKDQTGEDDKQTDNNLARQAIDDTELHLIDELDKVDGDNWLQHKFEAADDEVRLAKDASTKDDNWYSIEDPRNPMSKRIEVERSREYKHRARGNSDHHHHHRHHHNKIDGNGSSRSKSREHHSSSSRDDR